MRPTIGVALALLLSLGGPAWAADHTYSFTPLPAGVQVALGPSVVKDVDGNVRKVVQVPNLATSQLLEAYLAKDQIAVCSSSGDCSVLTVPLNALEKSVEDGTGPRFSLRLLVNADAPGAPLRQFDKVYYRLLERSPKQGERWHDTIEQGYSWSDAVEVTVTNTLPFHCNSLSVVADQPARIVVQSDNDTCGNGFPELVIVRAATFLAENDQQFLAAGNQPVECAPFAPIVVLHDTRSGYQVVTDDGLRNARQAIYVFGTPLP